MRTPAWAIVLVVLLIVGLGVYGYFTAPLPFGLNALVRTPGGSPPAQATPSPSVQRAAVGQPLGLGLVTVQVQATQRNVDLSGRGGPVGSFTVVLLQLQNGGTEALTPQASQFRLVDDRGRSYAVDTEATRAASQPTRRRAPFEATVPPGGRLDTELAFEVAADATALTLRVNLGYGEVELPR